MNTSTLFIQSILPILLISSAFVPAAKAQTQIEQQTTFNSVVTNSSFTNQIRPFDLAYLAYQGYFHAQGIPSYTAFVSAFQSGTISAKDLVQIAVKANQLPKQTLTNKGYLSAVEEQLRAFEKD